MNVNQAKLIIENYTPHKGFFDLSDKPETLSIVEYASILKIQNFLAEQNQQSDYLKRHAPQQWERLKEMSGELQVQIFNHWGDSLFSQRDEVQPPKSIKRSSSKWVIDGYSACLPEDVPLPFSLVSSSFKDKRTAIAKVKMFDGLQATVQVSKWADAGDAWSLQWLELDGGSINWNGLKWERINEDSLLGEPEQIELIFDEVPA